MYLTLQPANDFGVFLQFLIIIHNTNHSKIPKFLHNICVLQVPGSILSPEPFYTIMDFLSP
jgi:hypothetical protein